MICCSYLDGNVFSGRIDGLQSTNTVTMQPVETFVSGPTSTDSKMNMPPGCKPNPSSRCPLPRRIACFEYATSCLRVGHQYYTRDPRPACRAMTQDRRRCDAKFPDKIWVEAVSDTKTRQCHATHSQSRGSLTLEVRVSFRVLCHCRICFLESACCCDRVRFTLHSGDFLLEWR